MFSLLSSSSFWFDCVSFWESLLLDMFSSSSLSSFDLVGEEGSYSLSEGLESVCVLKASLILYLRLKLDPVVVKLFLVVEPETSVIVLQLFLRTFWLGRFLKFTRTLLHFLLPVVDGWPVQPEVDAGGGDEGEGAGEGAGGDGGAAGGDGSPGLGLT